MRSLGAWIVAIVMFIGIFAAMPMRVGAAETVGVSVLKVSSDAEKSMAAGEDFRLAVTIYGLPTDRNVVVSGNNGLVGNYGGVTKSGVITIPESHFYYDGSKQPSLTVSYDDDAGDLKELTYYFNKDQYVLGSTGAGDLVVESYAAPKTVYAGYTFDLSVTVKNSGKKALNNVCLSLTGLSAGGITVQPGYRDAAYIDIPAGSSQTVTFSLATDPKITTGTSILTAAAECGDLESSLNIYVQTYGKGEQIEEGAPELIGNQIVVSEDTEMPEIGAGETKTIFIPLEARSGVVGTAQVTLTMPDGLYLNAAAATQEVRLGRRGSETLIVDVTAREDVANAVIPITITSVYEYDEKEITETTTFSVKTVSAGQVNTDGLAITGYSLGSKSLSYNGNTDLVLHIENKSEVEMKDVAVRLEGLMTGSITLQSGMDIQTVELIRPGEMVKVTYKLHGDETLSDGTGILTASAECGSETSTVKVFVPCIGKVGGADGDGPGSSKPQVIIESYTYGEDTVVGGSTFNLAMVLKNTSAHTAIENIKMVISSAADDATGGVFTPASSSNSFYIARVAPGETFSEDIDLIVKADASPKSYGIDVDLSYEAVLDGVRQTLTATERITIPVTQPDRFEVDEAYISDYAYVGDSAWCSISYVNKGKSPIYNLSIAIEGTGFTTGESNTYVGNVDAGSGDYFEATLNLSEPGNLEGKFILTYEDSTGKESTLERPFSTYVQEMVWDEPVFDDGMMFEEPVEEGMKTWVKIVIIAGCVVVAGGIVFMVIRIRKKAKARKHAAAEDFEDDDYDE